MLAHLVLQASMPCQCPQPSPRSSMHRSGICWQRSRKRTDWWREPWCAVHAQHRSFHLVRLVHHSQHTACLRYWSGRCQWQWSERGEHRSHMSGQCTCSRKMARNNFQESWIAWCKQEPGTGKHWTWAKWSNWSTNQQSPLLFHTNRSSCHPHKQNQQSLYPRLAPMLTCSSKVHRRHWKLSVGSKRTLPTQFACTRPHLGLDVDHLFRQSYS